MTQAGSVILDARNKKTNNQWTIYGSTQTNNMSRTNTQARAAFDLYEASNFLEKAFGLALLS